MIRTALLFARALSLTLATCAIIAPSEAYAQNNMGAHPDTRPGRDHSPTLDYDTHQRKLISCMVYLPSILDPALREWCIKQSERMP